RRGSYARAGGVREAADRNRMSRSSSAPRRREGRGDPFFLKKISANLCETPRLRGEMLLLPPYQTTQRLGGAIAASALQEKALAKSGLSDTGPFTRHWADECGSVLARNRRFSGR